MGLDFAAPVHCTGLGAGVHFGGPAVGCAGLSVPQGPNGDFVGGGPFADHSVSGAAGHHHGGSGAGQADRHHRHHAVLPAAHRAQYLPRLAGGGPGCEGSGPGHGYGPNLSAVACGISAGFSHGVYRRSHRGGERHWLRRVRGLCGRRRSW